MKSYFESTVLADYCRVRWFSSIINFRKSIADILLNYLFLFHGSWVWLYFRLLLPLSVI